MRLELPLTFDDITIAMIQRHGDRDLSDIEKVQIFANVSHDEIKEFPYEVIKKASSHIDKILATPTQKHYKTLELDGVKYGFIPDWSEFSTGEYIDIETYSKDVVNNAHKIMSILYRPITREYNGAYEIEGYKGTEGANKFKDVGVGYYYGTLVFFLNTRRNYAMTSLKSLEAVANQMLLNKSSQKNGVGITSLSPWRVTMLRNWKRLRTFLLPRA
jgi:hypothetical protein